MRQSRVILVTSLPCQAHGVVFQFLINPVNIASYKSTSQFTATHVITSNYHIVLPAFRVLILAQFIQLLYY